MNTFFCRERDLCGRPVIYMDVYVGEKYFKHFVFVKFLAPGENAKYAMINDLRFRWSLICLKAQNRLPATGYVFMKEFIQEVA